MDVKNLLAETFPSAILSEYKIKRSWDFTSLQCEICFSSQNCNLIDIFNAYFGDTSLGQMLEYFPLLKECRIIECSFTLCLICVKQLVFSYLFLEKINNSNKTYKGLVKLKSKFGKHYQAIEEKTDSPTIEEKNDLCTKNVDDGFAALKISYKDEEPDNILHLRHVGNNYDHSYLKTSVPDCNEPTAEIENEDKLERIQILIEDVNIPKSEIICDLCKAEFVTTRLLRSHKNTVHKAKEIKCSQCSKKFKLRTQLKRHIMGVHNVLSLDKSSRGKVAEDKVECNICAKKFNKYFLKTHMERHSGSKNFQCEICGQKFFQHLSLNNHMIRHQDPKFSCEYCGKSHFTKQEMLTHIRRQHTREIVCSCQHCGKGFVHQTNLLQHIRNCHPGENEEKFVEPKIPKQCTVCGKIYSSRTSLIHHRRRAHENKEYSCTECDMTFRNRVPFKSHLKKIHNIGDTFNCNFCSKSFYTRDDFCKHKKRTHRAGINSWYLCCTVCETEKFKTKHELIQHMLGEHLIAESTGTPVLYECNVCITFFVNFEIFRKHLNKTHPNNTRDELIILEYEIGGCKVQYFQNKMRNVEHQ